MRRSALPGRAADGVGTSAASVEIRQALYKSYVRWPLGATAYGAFQVPECVNSTRIVSPRFVRHAHRAGLLVQVWTVNEETDMRRLMGWGVDGLITDRPDRALTTVALPALGHASSITSTEVRPAARGRPASPMKKSSPVKNAT